MDNVIRTTKVCKDCGRELPVAAFAHHPKSKDGLNSICKECMRKKQKASHPKGEKKKHAPAPAEAPAPKPLLTTKPTPGYISTFTDEELLDELRRRGFKGVIGKHFSL